MSENCTHNEVFGNLCVTCGQTVKKEENAIRGVHSRSDIWVQKNQVEEKHKTEYDSLMKEHKLVAILDLDHTLIHAADAPRKNISGPFYKLKLPRGRYLVKTRPGLDSFLSELSKNFELHVFTHGARDYAKGILSIIDPTKKYFHDRVVSRDDIDTGGRKTLSRIFPFSINHVIVVDDLTVAWKRQDSKQVVQITPYKYFKKGKRLHADSEEDDQHSLAKVLKIMQTVRRVFFTAGVKVRDVSSILQKMNERANAQTKTTSSKSVDHNHDDPALQVFLSSENESESSSDDVLNQYLSGEIILDQHPSNTSVTADESQPSDNDSTELLDSNVLKRSKG